MSEYIANGAKLRKFQIFTIVSQPVNLVNPPVMGRFGMFRGILVGIYDSIR
jgi:hypothetical protein